MVSLESWRFENCQQISETAFLSDDEVDSEEFQDEKSGDVKRTTKKKSKGVS